MMKKSLGGTTFWTATSTLVKILAGLLVMKLIAVYFGTEGVGRAANYMTLLTVLGVFAGGGIFNGVTKYVAEYENSPAQQAEMLSAAGAIVLTFSLCVGIIGLLFADGIASFIFAGKGYSGVIRFLAVAQFFIAFANFFLAILKGRREAKKYAVAVIAGVVIGLVLFVAAMYFGQYAGVLIGLALVPAVTVLPAYDLIKKCGQNSLHFLNPLKLRWHPEQMKKLFRFGLMMLSTAVTIPLAYILMRNWLEEARSIQAVGLWQGVTKISDAYLQFITAAFSVYLLPTFSRLTEKKDIEREVIAAFKFVFPATLAVSLTVYLCRPLIIQLLFTGKFAAMSELFLWQLIGDLFKVCAYILGYLVVAKAALGLYVLGEVAQFLLLLLFSSVLIPTNGAEGATQAYMLAYLIYFGICATAFWIYSRETE